MTALHLSPRLARLLLNTYPTHSQLWSGLVGAAFLAAALAGPRAVALPGDDERKAQKLLQVSPSPCALLPLLVLPSCLCILSQIINKVVAGGRPELPARQELPGPDTAVFAGLDDYCQLMRCLLIGNALACWVQAVARQPRTHPGPSLLSPQGVLGPRARRPAAHVGCGQAAQGAGRESMQRRSVIAVPKFAQLKISFFLTNAAWQDLIYSWLWPCSVGARPSLSCWFEILNLN